MTSIRARLRYAARRVRSTLPWNRPSGPPLIVYQMGKVGSSTVRRSLRSADPSREVIHVHLLAGLDELEAFARSKYANPAETLKQIAYGRRVRARIDADPTVRWQVITLVRAPVHRNVSAFFENLTEVIPDAFERRARGELTLSDLTTAFLEGYSHRAPLAWFQTQLEPVFAVDVFAAPFDPDAGWATYTSPRADVLLLRLEDLQRTGADAIRRFLDLPSFTLLTENAASQKPYADMYREYIADVRLPDDYLTEMYDSALARHFYTDDERRELRAWWSGSR